jgi:hypothetical protein
MTCKDCVHYEVCADIGKMLEKHIFGYKNKIKPETRTCKKHFLSKRWLKR